MDPRPSLDPNTVDLGNVDPNELRAHAPLLDAYWSFRESDPLPFTIPGHKQRTDLVGSVIAGDVPLFGGLDTMKVTHGTLARAESLAADLWGADFARFSVGGSTHGNQALALAVGQPGDHVIVSRTLHRSLLLGFVLAELHPIWLAPTIDADSGLPGPTSVQDVEAALAAHPEAVAVFLGDPSYVGTFSDIASIAGAVHRHDVPLIVDAAWGAHFGFHPQLPPHALAAGADAVVTSAHKTLPAYSAAALVLAQTHRLDAARLNAAFEATHTTSPGGAPLASIDAARALLELHGERLLDTLITVVSNARAELSRIAGLIVVQGAHVDPLKLTLNLATTGVDGVQLERALLDDGMPVELADRDTVVAMITIADTEATVDRLVRALTTHIDALRGEPRPVTASFAWTITPEQVISPRSAFFAPHEFVSIGSAVGRISAELIAPYPPGIPALAPGERISSEVVEGLRQAQASGTRIAYAADPALSHIRVVR
jgi:arginine decarboxylase